MTVEQLEFDINQKSEKEIDNTELLKSIYHTLKLIETILNTIVQDMPIKENSKSDNRDPLGLTKPPPICYLKSIEEDHKPEDADIIDKNRNSWKHCFVAYRIQEYNESDEDIAKLLKERPDAILRKRRRLHNPKNKNGKRFHRYGKFSQEFVDNWVDRAKTELTEIHDGNEKYALSLLPQDNE